MLLELLNHFHELHRFGRPPYPDGLLHLLNLIRRVLGNIGGVAGAGGVDVEGGVEVAEDEEGDEDVDGADDEGGALVGAPSAAASSSSSSVLADSDPSASGSLSLGHLTRPDFPILHQEVNGSKLVYLDNAATSQKPSSVLKAVLEYYEAYNSNVHRGIHFLSVRATDEYELARKKVAQFINAGESRDIIFTRNATEAINLVAHSWGLSNLKPEDEIVLTIAEHHSAIVPWQIVSKKTGAILKFVDLDGGEVPDVSKLRGMLSKKTKLVVVHHVSNMLASILPIEDIVQWAHDVQAKVLVDACQSVPHMAVDVKALDVDFLVASSHKALDSCMERVSC